MEGEFFIDEWLMNDSWIYETQGQFLYQVYVLSLLNEYIVTVYNL
jgi:hypothetical protein